MQARFAKEESVYKRFLEILNMYRQQQSRGTNNISEVYKEVSQHLHEQK